jgi:hypothetical protein
MRWLASTLIALAFVAIGGVAHAETYPVSGTWTYDNANEAGPAKECGKRIMRFEGGIRHDTGTSAPTYRNISVTQNGNGSWRVVDEFYTVQIRGRINYILRVVDADHIELQYDRINIQSDRGPGKSSLLRRCL